MAETFNRASAALTTSFAQVYAAPTNSGDVSVVLSVLVSNVDTASASDFTAAIYSGGSAVAGGSVAKEITVPQKASMEFVPNKVILKAGESLQAKASTAGDLEVTISALEIT